VAVPEVGGFIIGTNVAPPEPRTDVELSHSRKVLDWRSSEVRFSGAGRADSGEVN
jgi:hypothetical protein